MLSIPAPDWFLEERIKLRFNASEVLESGNVPMARILEEVKSISQEEIYLFTTPFFPAPIIEILSNRGYNIWSRRKENIVETYVTK